MTRYALALVCGAVLLLVPLHAQQAVFRANVEGVSVSVTVRRAGQVVTGLTAADFELLDNDVAQELASVSVETLPIDVTLLLDASGSVQGQRLERLKQAVLDTAKLLRPEDRLRLIAVQHAVYQVFPFQPGGSTPPVERLTASGGTSLFDGLTVALIQQSVPDRRPLVVAYTDGQDTISVLGARTVREVSGFTDAVVHFVVPSAGGRNRATGTTATLAELATQTGGTVFWVDYDAPMTAAFVAAIGEFRQSYVLRYTPRGVTPGGWHDVTVRVKGAPAEITARKGYGGD